MFEVSIAVLARVLLVFIGYKLYRMSVGRGVSKQHVTGRRANTMRGAIRAQQGYIYLKRSYGRKAGEAKLSMVDGDSKAPWGW